MKSSVVLPLLVLGAACNVPIATAQFVGSFAPTGSLTTERASHTATLLPNGKVLVAGGWATLAGWPVWASAELYDSSTGTFSATGGMTTPRTGHTATLLPDGRVLIAGGGATVNMDGSAQASAELYDPSAGSFAATGSMADGRSGHTATLLNTGQVLITGGSNYAVGGIPNYLAAAELYDPLTGHFKPTGSMYAARAGHAATLLANGKVLIDGGGAGDSEPSPELYDPATGTFSVTGPSASPEGWLIPGSASLLPNGKVLETLAFPGDFDNHSEMYDPNAGTFSATANMTTNRGYRTATLLPAGKVLIDGRDDTHFGGSSEVYDPVTGTFTATTGMFPQSEEGHTSTLLPDGTVLLAGGWICCGFSVANAEIYRPAVLAPAPVLFSLSGDGKGQGAVWNAITGQLASANAPATAGDVLAMYTASLFEGGVVPPQVAIGGKLADVLYFGGAPGYPGYYQVNFRVPSGVAPGSGVPVRLTYIGRPSNAVTVGVQ